MGRPQAGLLKPSGFSLCDVDILIPQVHWGQAAQGMWITDQPPRREGITDSSNQQQDHQQGQHPHHYRDEHLICTICTDVFTDPRVLCSRRHIYCLPCIQVWMDPVTTTKDHLISYCIEEDDSSIV